MSPYEPIPGETAPQPMWNMYGDTNAVYVKIVVTLKGEKRTAFGSAECQTGADASTLKCNIEGDGGGFTLTRQSDTKYLLKNASGFAVEFPSADDDEPNDGFVLVDPKDDHDAFALAPSSGGLCDTDWTTGR